MKKTLYVALLAGLMTVLGMPCVQAATTAVAPITTRAEVTGGLTLSVTLQKNDFDGDIITSMDFGTLMEFENPDTHGKTLRSMKTGSTGTAAVLAWIGANSHGAQYAIKQTGTALSSGASTLPEGACCVVPVYVEGDNGGAAINPNAALGSKGTWVATDKLIYQSEPTPAQMRTLRAYYSITDDPKAGATSAVLLGQPTGVYNGTITFTVTT